MPKQRQIPFLFWRPCSSGPDTAHWKPSPRLRKAGWTNRQLGTRDNEREVILAALALNEQVAQWQAGRAALAVAAAPRRPTFADLVDDYRQGQDWQALKPASQREYDVRLRALSQWAKDGTLHIDLIDDTMVQDLADALTANKGSLFRANGMVRVLRIVMRHARRRKWIKADPTEHVRLPAAPRRSVVVPIDAVAALDAAAAAAGWPALALGFQLGLWTMQREEDLLQLNRMNWRTIDNCDPADAAVLANPKGEVRGFRLKQQKTGVWVDCPVPPWLHTRIDAMFERSQYLCHDDDQPARACPDYQWQRRVRRLRRELELTEYRFGDLRRSGMCMLRDAGAETPWITAISGHKVLMHESILDTYLPANTRIACKGMATAIRAHQARLAREQTHG